MITLDKQTKRTVGPFVTTVAAPCTRNSTIGGEPFAMSIGKETLKSTVLSLYVSEPTKVKICEIEVSSSWAEAKSCPELLTV